MKKLIFKLSKLDTIKIVLNENIDIEEASLCTEVKIYLQGVQDLYIGEGIIAEVFESFILHLTKAIQGELQLHESLTENIGFIYNQYFDDVPTVMLIESPNHIDKHWVIYDYKMWAGQDNDQQHSIITWLYNDKQGNIILETSKIYPWFYIQDGDTERSDFIYYDDFIKNYQPLSINIIDPEVAILLLKKAYYWMNIFTDNEKYCLRPRYILNKK